jgi:TRAP-type mannitol/chloroaromatic compound transport system permease large subunit
MLVSILFIQSGLDKMFDWRGNLEWLTGHFSKTFLRGTVPPMLATITLMEIATGILSAIGIVYFLITSSTVLIFYASILGAASIVALFFGQRIAKDYAGAAVLIPYFILLIILMFLTNPFLKVL